MKSKKAAESLDFLSRRLRCAGARANESHHVDADLRQQLIEQFLAVLEMIVEGALRDAGFLGDAGDGGFRVAIFADDFCRGVEDLLLGPGVALDAVELCHLGGRVGCLCHAVASSSARKTRFNTLPEGLRGRCRG